MIHLLSAESTALIESNEELVVIPSGAVNVNAVEIVNIAGAVDQSGERSVEMNADFHVFIRAFSGYICAEPLWSTNVRYCQNISMNLLLN